VCEGSLILALLIDGDLLVFILTSFCFECLLCKIAETLLSFYLITHQTRRAREVDMDFHIFSLSALDGANSYVHLACFTTRKMTLATTLDGPSAMLEVVVKRFPLTLVE